MYKNYIVPIIFCLLTLGVVGFFTFYAEKPDAERKTEYDVVFNSATLEQKIVGLTYDEIAGRYAPAEKISGKKSSGYFSAHYNDLRIYTKGENHISRGMTVQFKKGTAASVKPDKADEKESLSAEVINLNNLTWHLIDAEIGTRDVTVLKGGAEGALKYLVIIAGILFILLVGAGGFFIIWPLLTLIVKKIGGWGARVLGLALVLGISWLWFPFIAYSMDNIGLYLGVGGFVKLIGLIGLLTVTRRHVPVYSGSSSSSSSYSPPTPSAYWGRYQIRVPRELAMNHVEILWYLLIADPDTDTAWDLHTRIANDLHVSDDDYGIAIQRSTPDSYTPSVVVPAYAVHKREFVKDSRHIVLDGKTMLKSSVLYTAARLAVTMGIEMQDFLDTLKDIAENEYHLAQPWIHNDMDI
jgi:hypothetical protein